VSDNGTSTSKYQDRSTICPQYTHLILEFPFSYKMRPLPGDDAFTTRSRSGSAADNDTTPLASRSQPPQMTYFIADEKAMEASQSHSPTILPKHRDFSKSSTYGVESLETTISSLAHDSDESEEKVRRARQNWKKHLRQQTLTRPARINLSILEILGRCQRECLSLASTPILPSYDIKTLHASLFRITSSRIGYEQSELSQKFRCRIVHG